MKDKHRHAIMMLWVAMHAFLLFPLSPLLAQNTKKVDQLPPVIRHSPFETAQRLEEVLIFEANIQDNLAVNKVKLFYRTAGQQNYSSLKMEGIGQTKYLGIVPRRFMHQPGLEYYIQASDRAGNTTTQGSAKAPLIVKFTAPEKQANKNIKSATVFPVKKGGFRLGTPTDMGHETKRKGKPWYKRWWVWSIAIGVIAGVAVAGSGGSSGETSPTTGTGTVSADIP